MKAYLKANVNSSSNDFRDLLKSSIESVLGPLELEPDVDLNLSFGKGDYAAMMGVYGPGIKATIVLAMTRGSLTATHPSGDPHLSDFVVRDWIGELTNVIAGQLRQKFLQIKTRVSPPSVDVDPITVLESYFVQGITERLCLKHQGDCICCQVKIEADVDA